MILHKDSLIANLESGKIKINWNKKPIGMKTFLSNLTIPVHKSTDNLGIENGWTEYTNEEYQLIISGGIVARVEYLDSIQYGEKLANRYNNYVNPFYLWDILTDKGKHYFLDYYRDDINNIIEEAKINVTEHKKVLKTFQEELKSLKENRE